MPARPGKKGRFQGRTQQTRPIWKSDWQLIWQAASRASELRQPTSGVSPSMLDVLFAAMGVGGCCLSCWR